MPSDPPHLDLQQQDHRHHHHHPLPHLPLQQSPSNTDAFRGELHHLDITAQSLRAEKAALLTRLQVVREKIFANDNHIRRTMENLSSELFRSQRAERQPEFQARLLNNDNFIEGMYYQMQAQPQLLKAIHAVTKEEGTVQDNNLIAAAIMTELTGNTFQFGHDVAARVTEFEKAKNESLAVMGQPVFDGVNAFVDPTFAVTDPALEDGAALAIQGPSASPLGSARDMSIVALMSPSVKSEGASIATPFNVANSLPDLTAAALTNTPANVALSIETTPVRQSPRATVVAQGMTSLQKSFPGLLESIGPANSPPRPRSAVAAMAGKRGRESVEPNDSPSPSVLRVAKKPKNDKEPAISHTFINYMKHLEQLHRGGKSISSTIRCSRCQQIKRDVRVLNCLHLYCHRCVLQLRGQAQHGNAVTGFQSTCVKPGCNQVVSGKTTVIDSEIVDFLQWYDQQSPVITSKVCQLHVLNTASARYPDDDGIKAKLQQVQSQFRAAHNAAVGDQPVDLMVIAKLCRKPYL
ncbi:hypothetical protein G647_09646 [Cladophialophora carrionii CBS 160.54]|uniref:RING-type domain-containing protein n=1 Tax=Cladophialophora carrionii CBS 160.54 TaxID=1279043 RepID=V9DLD3_9EURO|nr:uncharacterized protein G647_09646 [Cladophialophora carrionii CBS 160.54]ETI27456.1 hypothetical protein G647_09646 [Cladophialophora carrionii CBS 160.54]